MTDQPVDPVQALFDQAVEFPPAERAAFLDGACRGDASLRADVESLLTHDLSDQEDGDGALLKSPLVREDKTGVFDGTAPPATTAGLPERIGRYRILRCLDEGGMGIVYEAEQDSPRRRVALKVMRPGRVSANALKRFEQEAQILGRLHHPGIAQIYEAGIGEDGLPFFAMEFIRGVPLNQYVQMHVPDPAARLALVARVCDAVQHAHDQGIIHRDLKPGNILVDESGQPKVLDFGIARATDSDLKTAIERTQTGQLLGTPLYMSPEQVAGNPSAIDQRCDVYALGVILYQMLADQLPYQLGDLPLPDVMRVILDQEPVRLGSINSLYRGDVETIVAKALDKDKERRYFSAGSLAADICRYLNHEPILARPPSALYQMRKFVRRHKALVIAVLAVMAALLAGLVGTMLFAIQAGHNAHEARLKEKESRYQTYRARIAAAVADLTGHDVTEAAQQLDEAPEELRGWEWYHLHSRLDDSAAVVHMHDDEKILLERGPEGMRIVGFTDDRFRILDLGGHELLSRPCPRTGLFWSDPRTGGVLTHVGGPPEIYDLADEDARIVAHLPAFKGLTAGLKRFSPDASRLAVHWWSDTETFIAVYQTGHDMKLQAHIPVHEIWTMDLSSDNTQVAFGGEDGVARIWDMATGKLTAECRGHRLKIRNLAFRRDGRRLVTASADGSVRQWDTATGLEAAPPYERHTGEVTTVTYSPDGDWIASGGTDRTVRVWRAADRQELVVLHGHTRFMDQLTFTEDGKRVISVGDYMGALGIGRAGLGDSTVRIWEAQPGVGLPVLLGHTSYVYPVAFSADGQWIASGGWDRTVRLWDAVTGELCKVFPHDSNVRALAFAADSSWLVSTCDAGDRLQIWDVATGQRRKQLLGPGLTVQATVVSPDGRRIALAEGDGKSSKLSVVDSDSGQEIARWTAAAAWEDKLALAYSPDGRFLAGTATDFNIIDVWDAHSLEPIVRLKGHTAPVHALAFSPDSRRLASTGNDRTVRIWDVATGECLHVLHGHTDQVFGLAFHPDGKRLASAGRDRSIWLWDMDTHQEVARLQGHTNYVFSLDFSPDGKTLVSGSGDGTVRLWDTFPLSERYQARREAVALRPEAERIVGRLFAEKNDAAAVVAAIRSDPSLTEPLRREALHEVLRRGR